MSPNESSAWDTARKDVFVINDINLIVPPSQISIQREDLVWSWKTLRTKSSTKIPSGQGQIQIRLSIVFTNSMMLDLHRLIVQFRQSPFCYIDNRYLRESIVPEWPIHQNLAFTMTSLNIAPLGGSSDSWVAEIDLVWFNYFPYGFNFVYRKDWRTHWLDNYGDAEGVKYKASIGWQVIDGKKTHTPSIVAVDTGDAELQSWDLVTSNIQNTSRRNIYELEQLHKGEVFDTQPLPGNMEPAQMVMQPKESNIYVRYINLLQRDALKESFGIDIEADLRAIGVENYFFGVVGSLESEPEKQVTIPLHDLSLLEVLDPVSKDKIERLQKRWLSEMLRHNRGVTFHWSTYKSIKMPPKFMERMQKSQQTLIQKLMADGAIPAPSTIVHHGTIDNHIGGTEVRQGFSLPNGKFTPLGLPGSTTPMAISDLHVTSRVGWRDQQTLDRAYSDGRHRQARMHKGTDFRAPVGSPLFAIADGRVLSVGRTENRFVWKEILDDGTGERIIEEMTPRFEAALNSTGLPWTFRSDNGRQRAGNPLLDKLGVAIKYGNFIYFTDFSNDGGLSIVIQHDEGGKSVYSHVSNQSVVSANDRVVAGQLIGYSSNTSQIVREFNGLGTSLLSTGWANWLLIPGSVNAYEARQIRFSLAPHLHFEWWERRDIATDTRRTLNNSNDLLNAGIPDPLSGQVSRDENEYVLVDPVPSYQNARTKTLNYIDIPDVPNILESAAETTQRAYENGELSIDEVQAFMTFISGLTTEGWYYYEGDDKIINVWEQPKSLTIQDTPLDRVNEYSEDSVVLTNLSGGLRHVVANLPILGHEYPTQQHLGSTEPVYAFEFAVVDDKFDANGAIKNLEGISQKAQMLQWLRSGLQTNARAFREVVDGWCVATDSFITRLLGSYKHGDYTVTYSNNGQEETRIIENTFEDKVINSFKLKKRTVISRESSGTVEGNPGLSSIFFELEETNPYADEKLVPVNPSLKDVEDSKKQVLHAIYNFNINGIASNSDVSRDELLALLIASANDVNTDTNSPDFGKFRVLDNPLTFWGNSTVVETSATGARYTFIDSEGSFISLLNQIGVQTSNLGATWWNLGSVQRTSVELPSVLVASANPINATTITEYSIRQLLEAHPEFVDMPIEFLIDHHKLVKATINMAETILAEHQDTLDRGVYTGDPGLSILEVQQQLYDLPVNPSMWRKWQWYQYSYVGYLHDPAERIAAINSLVTSPGWLRFREDLPLAREHQLIADNIAKSYSIETLLATEAGAVTNLGAGLFMTPITNFNLVSTLFEAASSGSIQPLTNQSLSVQQERSKSIAAWFVKNYMTYATGVYGLESQIKRYSYDYVFGDTLTDLVSGRSQVNELNSMHAPLEHEVLSGGMWGTNGVGLPRYLGLDSSPTLGLYLSDILSVDTIGLVSDVVGVTPRPPNSIHIWKVQNSQENSKLRYIKDILSDLAQQIINNPDALRALGLSHLLSLIDPGTLAGSAAYPDLDLPTHPYYGDEFSVDPDFYMWNIYEDGQAFSVDVMSELESSLEEIIDRSYQSIRNLEAGERPLSRQSLLLEDDPTAPLPISQKIQAEGSITPPTNNGPMASPFYPTDVTNAHVADWLASYEQNAVNIKKQFRAQANAAIYDSPSITSAIGNLATTTAALPSSIAQTVTTTTQEQIADNRSLGIRLGTGEGAFGQGGGLHAPMRVAPGQYEQLKENWENIHSMFGAKQGYLARHGSLNALSAQSPEQRNNLERLDDPGHFFDADALKKLAKESSIDLTSQRLTMKQAYPTFKLYFVEEDENEDRLLNFDDFYSYNAVKEFMVTSSRKLPADHAVIILQNVGGTLDGTKRGVVTDLDYFGKDVRDRTTFQNSLPIESVVEDTTADQPFGALVLRPGMNIQLRAGYSNDPRNLHVLISGRVVDLTWNKSGDLTEIMVQSFGTELVQELKGIDKNNGDTFYTTHQLLGSMMLEPEVTHFGRWEFGQLYQIGESKDSRLDFYEYSREGYLGKFTAFNSVTRFIMNHWALFGAALIGGTIISLLPGAGRFGSGIAKVFGRRSIDDIAGKAVGEEGFKAIFATGTGWAERTAAKQVLRTQARSILRQSLRGISDAEKRSLGASYMRLLRNVNTATNVDDAVKASLEAEAFIRSRPIYGFLTGSFTNTWADIGLSSLPSIGWSATKTVGRTWFWDAGTALTKIGVVLLGIDLYSEILLRPFLLRKIKAVKDFFKARQAHLFLSPQDDNLYPPHPKDYMDLGANYFFELSTAFAGAISRGLGLPEELNEFIWDSSFFTQVNEALLKKTVHPDQAQYQLAGSTIWDVFHEMSLRHPGWIYGARPYGNRFRYTMFFGVPSQRYWSRPASNEFIDRMNDLYRVLSDDRVTLREYEYINGNTYPGGVDKDTYLAQMRTALSEAGGSEILNLSDVQVSAEFFVERQLKAHLMKEYLRGLELRFVPFRRYHLISSSNNLIWNGIMSSENAVSNAVDVTYYPPDSMASESGMPSGTALYKAHSRIPDTKLRIAPIRYPNCKGYTMANRYGMGELLHRMREMYRGEIIIRGNPRIKPWDIGILVDDYHQMVGPIEVEQFVHTFSHETGFITEIKPAACVFGNEISSWPMVEAMKLFALAVKDFENNYTGSSMSFKQVQQDGMDASGLFGTVVDLINNWGDQNFNSFLKDKYIQQYGELAVTSFSREDLQSSELYRDTIGSGALTDAQRAAVFGLENTGGFLTGGGLALGMSTLMLSAGKMANLGSYTSAQSVSKVLGGLPSDLAGIITKNPKLFVGAGIASVIAGAGLAFSANAVDKLDDSSMWLAAGAVLMLNCLRNDAIMLIPLMKNGHPIVSGLTYNDPDMMWHHLKGDLGRLAHDTITGTRDVTQLWSQYGFSLWRRGLMTQDMTGQ